MGAKSIKSVAKEAKMRLKSKFWEEYKREKDDGVKLAREEGIAPSGVEKYFRNKIVRTVKGEGVEEENFYLEVKDMLDNYGKPSDALDRLMDKPYFKTLDYENRERYLLRLSERYQRAVERYDKERAIEKKLSE
ncbi:MAG: hypothetical protein IJ800_06975 [Clostridia bacterium]|nr:hypothetical protein [Clostridia bacterium]